ncbi:MAG TPA: hypothetical protein VM692_10890 [Gammaproteobacteria bacterium]|nr:hypothetical protein [Gammaproteobacteria bacterium]
MNVVRFRRDGKEVPSAAWLLCCAAALSASSAAAQVARLAPVGKPVEVVDSSERISGNAAAGVVLVQEGDAIGSDRLWGYLSEPVPAQLKLRISSIDGRYYAEVDYTTASQQAGWVALDLPLSQFSFLEKNYKDPLSEIAALLAAADEPRFYPLRWGSPHRAAAAPPQPPKDTDPLRVYVNTERAQAFVVVDGGPAYCRDASAVSGFKFNAICDVALGDVRNPVADAGASVVSGIEVFRRSGVRTLAPLALDVLIRY